MGEHIVRVKLDVLKYHQPNILELASILARSIPSVNVVRITTVEINTTTETVSLIVEGKNLDFKQLKEVLDKYNCSIHSIDEVVVYKVKKE